MLIAAALLLTIGTVFVMRSYLAGQRRTPTQVVQAPVGTEVLVARSDLPTGLFVNEQHLRWQTWPDDDLPETYLVKGKFDEKGLFGGVVRRSISTGQPVLKSQIVQSGSRGFLAAVLRPGYRAYTIKINAASSNAGMVFPGDRIDLLLSHKIKGVGSVTETFMVNLRILAIDQSLNDQTGTPRVGKTATFEVTPKQAELLAVAEGIGRMSLVVRSLAKNEEELRQLIESGEPLKEGEARKGRTFTRQNEASVLMGFTGAGVSVVRGGALRKEKGHQ